MAATVLLPVESTTRDLDARLVLAARWVRPGRRVVVGAPADVVTAAEQLEGGGVYLGKSLFQGYREQAEGQRSARDYGRVRARGFSVAHLEDEGALLAGSRAQREHAAGRIPALAYLDTRDTLCAWGSFDQHVYRQLRPDIAERVIVTGHPRFALYRSPLRAYYEPAAAALRAELGPFVLVATTTARANPISSLERIFSASYNYQAADPRRRLAFVRQWGHTQRQLARCVELVHRLADEIDATIVVRPHPSEDESLYHAVLAGLDRVVVRREGPVSPWLLACSALLQDGCTTAVEGYLAGCPVLTYVPAEVETAHRRPLASWVGTECENEQSVIDNVRRALAGGRSQVTLPDEARELLCDLADGDAGLDGLDALIERECPPAQPGASAELAGLGRALSLARARRTLAEVARNAREAIEAGVRGSSHELRRARAERRYARAKFDVLRRADIDSRARAAARVAQRTDLAWQLLGDRLVVFEAAR
ncbi:MAG: hypothetical protein KC503_09520 [Myxococcales bacterium]|nr:hypothetical protein [Myxococcales bacterium]